VLKESTCPDGWYVYEYILTHPTAARTAELFGVRDRGGMSHYGVLRILDEARVAVHVRAVDSPRVLPFELMAEYDGRDGALRIQEAIATAARPDQRRPAVPSAEEPRRR
jgi:hypothetical protein